MSVRLKVIKTRLACALLCTLVACTSAAPVVEQKLPSIGYGVHTFLWWNYTTRPRDLEFVRLLRFDYVKQIFGWKDIQPSADLPPIWEQADEVMAEAQYRGLKVVARLGKVPDWAVRAPRSAEEPPFDVAAFGAFCEMLSARYQGRIAAYQVWNEPNLDREWLGHSPNAAAYVKVLAACAAGLRRADPAAVVISAPPAPTGSLSPQVIPDEQYLRQMYDAGLRDHYDVLGLNAPGYLHPPETAPDDPRLDGQRWQVFRHVEDMRAIMTAAGEGHKQIAILEMGWTTDTRDTIVGPDGAPLPNPYRWHAVSEGQQAAYLVGAYDYAAAHWRPWISLMIAIYIPDPDWTEANEEYWWSLITPGYAPRMRPAFIDLANSARSVDAVYKPPIDPARNPYTPLPPRPRTP